MFHALFSRRFALLAVGIAVVLGMPSRSHAHLVIYDVTMDGASEAPPNASPGLGTARITFDLDLVTMRVQASFSGLIGNVTAAHIHAATAQPGTGTAGVATTQPTFTGFPSGVTAGSYDNTFDMTVAASYNPAFVTANGGTVSTALTALLAAAEQGRAYFNIHTSFVGTGEIRGFLIAAVPEPSSLLLSGMMLAGLVAGQRRRRVVA